MADVASIEVDYQRVLNAYYQIKRNMEILQLENWELRERIRELEGIVSREMK